MFLIKKNMPKTIVLGEKEVYVLSRLGIMAILSFNLNTIALSRYCSWVFYLLISVFSVITGAAISLMTVSFSQNRMKGMAITKLSGLIVISFFVPFFADKNIWWIVSFLPPFWLVVGVMEERLYMLLISCILSLICLELLYSVYLKKES